MFRHSALLALLFGGVFLLVVLPVAGEDKKPDASDKEDALARARLLKDLVAAYRLVEIGRSNKVPEALLTAATLLHKIGRNTPADITEKPLDEKGNEIQAAALKTPSLEDQAKD